MFTERIRTHHLSLILKDCSEDEFIFEYTISNNECFIISAYLDIKLRKQGIISKAFEFILQEHTDIQRFRLVCTSSSKRYWRRFGFIFSRTFGILEKEIFVTNKKKRSE